MGAGEAAGAPVAATVAAVPRDAAQKAQFTAAAGAASRFMTLFARPAQSVTAQQWWAKVKPLLTDDATLAYAGTDPAQVGFTTVTGPAVVLPADARVPTALLCATRVPTDSGWYRVEVTTTPQGVLVTYAAPETDQATAGQATPQATRATQRPLVASNRPGTAAAPASASAASGQVAGQTP